MVDQPGFGFPTHFRVLADAGSENEQEVLVELEPCWPAHALPNPGAAPIMIATPGLQARRIRVTCEALWASISSSGRTPKEFLLAMGELQVWHEGKNLALDRPVECASRANMPLWTPNALTDGYSSRESLIDWESWLSGIERAKQLQAELVQVQLSIQVRHEVLRLRMLWAAIGAAGIASLLGLTGILWFRSGAQRIQEELRACIARDLHDEIGASLSELAIQSDLARQQLLRGDLLPKRLEAISAGARQTLDQIRDVIWLLTPKKASNWRELSNRMQSIAKRMLEDIKHEVVIQGDPPQGGPSIEFSKNVLTFLKEVLTNARRHSQAEFIRVDFRWVNGLTLSIEDNGRGFELDTARNTSGTGLLNLEQRAVILKGSLNIQSHPGNGTKISLSIPLPNERKIT
jgi:signal transduction histidine kinase